MYQKGVLTINEWQTGVADSATLGFGAINNCEILENPGVLKIAPASILKTPNAGISLTGLPIAFTEDMSGNNYLLTDNGVLWREANGLLYVLQSGLTGANDIIFYRDYIWVSYGSGSGVVGLYGPTSGASTFFPNWATGLTTRYKKFIVCQNDVLYLSNGTNIVSFTGFSPAVPFVTPTPISPVVTGWSLPGVYANTSGTTTSSQFISIILEYGRNILIGTTTGNIYQWDRADTQLVDVPFKMSYGGIKQLITKENRLYITVGDKGNIYMGDGTNFQKFQKIKWRQRRPFNSTADFKPNAIAISPTGSLLVGSSTLSDSTPSTSLHGVHEVSLVPNYATCFKHTISTGNTGANNVLHIGFVYTSTTGVVYIGWSDGSTYGLDAVYSTGANYTTATVETPLYQIATRLDQLTFTKLEFKLATPMVTGQSLSIQFRKNLTDSWDTARTFSYSTLGAVNIHQASASLTNIDQLQVKITLTSPVGVGLTNLELLAITLW